MRRPVLFLGPSCFGVCSCKRRRGLGVVLMPKRKADGHGRATPARLPPPPPADDSADDSDCQVIEPPSSSRASVSAAAQPSIPPQRSILPRPLAPAAHPSAPYTFVPSNGRHNAGNAGVLSMLAGLSQAIPHHRGVQPAQAGGFSFAPMQIPPMNGFFGDNRFGYRAPEMLAHRAGFQGGGFMPGPAVPNPMASSSAGASSAPPLQGKKVLSGTLVSCIQCSISTAVLCLLATPCSQGQISFTARVASGSAGVPGANTLQPSLEQAPTVAFNAELVVICRGIQKLFGPI